jgi:hypothetical protein
MRLWVKMPGDEDRVAEETVSLCRVVSGCKQRGKCAVLGKANGSM